MSLQDKKIGTSLGGTTLSGGTSLGTTLNTLSSGTSLGTTLNKPSSGTTLSGGTSLGTTLNKLPSGPTLNTLSSGPTLNKPPLPKQQKTQPRPRPRPQPNPTQPKESAIAIKIKQMQEENRKKEDEEERRRKEEEEERKRIEMEEEKRRKDMKDKLKLQKQLQLENNKLINEQKEKDLKIQSASAKYGYVPNVINKNYMKKDIIKKDIVKKDDDVIVDIKNDLIVDIKNDVIVDDVDDVVDDWDVSDVSEDVVDIKSVDIKNVDVIVDDIVDDVNNLRSPIVCVLGHVDAGKTHLLDKIRSSAIHMGEAGKITQQIGASYVPIDTIIKYTKHMDDQFKNKLNYKVNGLIFIDTPGHEPFMNMRNRGSSLCDIAILVVDILVGLQKQTLECIKLLANSKKLFVIALNKVDLLYGWKSLKGMSIKNSLKIQNKNVIMEFENRVKYIWTQLQELGHNAELYYKNKDMDNTTCMVPLSAITGEGLPDLLMLLAQLSQKYMGDKLVKSDVVDCSVLEVKNVVGRGMTIDVILTNGSLSKGDKIMICGIKGEPIITNIRALLVHTFNNRKGEYGMVAKVNASMTCKIDAPGLDDAVAGSPLYVLKDDDDSDDNKIYKMNVMRSLDMLKSKICIEGDGVYVNSSSLGALEALFEYLGSDECNVDIGGFRIGPVHKKDVTKASGKKYPCILAFDVNIDDDVRRYADSVGVKIFEEKIIYKLFDMFSEYIIGMRKVENDVIGKKVVFPCVCEIMPDCVFNKKGPIIVGVSVRKGILKKGTMISVLVEDGKLLDIGYVESIEQNHKPVEEAIVGDNVCVRIVQKDGEQQYSYGRHFDDKNMLYSKISRESIDAMKILYPDILGRRDIFKLVKELKELFGIF